MYVNFIYLPSSHPVQSLIFGMAFLTINPVSVEK